MASVAESTSTSTGLPSPSGFRFSSTRNGVQSASGTRATSAINSCERTAEIAKPITPKRCVATGRNSGRLQSCSTSAKCPAESLRIITSWIASGSNSSARDSTRALPQGRQVSVAHLAAQHRARLRQKTVQRLIAPLPRMRPLGRPIGGQGLLFPARHEGRIHIHRRPAKLRMRNRLRPKPAVRLHQRCQRRRRNRHIGLPFRPRPTRSLILSTMKPVQQRQRGRKRPLTTPQRTPRNAENPSLVTAHKPAQTLVRFHPIEVVRALPPQDVQKA